MKDIRFINQIATQLHGFSSTAKVYLLPSSGSDRKFYRVQDNDKSLVFMQSTPEDTEFAAYVKIAQFLQSINIGVPVIYKYDSQQKWFLAEDLGDLTLEKAVKQTTDPKTITPLYQQVLNTLTRMQVLGKKEISSCPSLSRIFDYDTLRWETSYFTEYFLEKYCHLKITNRPKLDAEFHALASKLADEPLYFMHRDFQSQNILIKDGKIRIIDFQSARQGLLAYDLASVLKDTYIVLPDETREKLLDYYIQHLQTNYKINLDSKRFRQTFLCAGLQRNMQALGAFSRLTLDKGKRKFQKYIPTAVPYLKSALQQNPEFPVLSQIVNSLPL